MHAFCGLFNLQLINGGLPRDRVLPIVTLPMPSALVAYANHNHLLVIIGATKKERGARPPRLV
jgi:hypothetical protein